MSDTPKRYECDCDGPWDSCLICEAASDPLYDLGELEARLDPRRPDRAADVSESEVAALCVEVRQQREALERLRAMARRTRDLIDALPHGPLCAVVGGYSSPCDCWKRPALADIDETLDAAALAASAVRLTPPDEENEP